MTPPADGPRRGPRQGRGKGPDRGAGSGRPRRAPGPGGRFAAGDRGRPAAADRPERDREDRPRRPRVPEPPLPDDVTGAELDKEVRADLRSLSREGAAVVARHLVMAARLVDTDPETAWQHAQAAQRRAGRIGAVREAAGITAYHAGHYEEALRELRTARRLTGSDVHLPVMADCERGLGRPERALTLASSAEAGRLDAAGQVEMRIVAAGARIDMGNPEAAVVLLQPTAGRAPAGAPWRARVYSALSDALAAAGRAHDARQWLERAAAADVTGETGAYQRLTGASQDDDETVIDLLEGLDDADSAGDPRGSSQPSA